MFGFSITNFNLICHQSMYPDLAKDKLTRVVRFSIKLLRNLVIKMLRRISMMPLGKTQIKVISKLSRKQERLYLSRARGQKVRSD